MIHAFNVIHATARRLRSIAGQESSQHHNQHSASKKIANKHNQHHNRSSDSDAEQPDSTQLKRRKRRKARPAPSSSDESSSPPSKKKRPSAIAAQLKLSQSPTSKLNNTNQKTRTANGIVVGNGVHHHLTKQQQHNHNAASDNHTSEDATTQTTAVRQQTAPNNFHQSLNHNTTRHKRSRSISSSCSRRSPVMNGDYDDQSEEEDQIIRLRCPVDGCNSEGHLSGKFESHFTQTTCPIYHNFTPAECEERYQSRLRGRRIDVEYVKNVESSRPTTPCSRFRESDQDTPTKANNRTHLPQSPNKNDKQPKHSSAKASIKSEKTDSDKSLLSKLVEFRKREINQIIVQSSTPQKRIDIIRNPSREPYLKNLAPIFDYEMFKEAQAKAAEQLQGKAKDVRMRYGIRCIDLGRYEIDVWYGSPYPEEYRYLPKLYICEYCLKYMTSEAVSSRHMHKCLLKHPPGNEIYRRGNLSFFEVDGQQNEIYCQNLCLLAKLFLDHKTLYFDVAPFLFYVLTEYDEEGFHILGYFSKEKNSIMNYNVSCILTLPPYQKQGYGKLLIDLSYMMTKLEGKVGSPEKPLSDMGLISYRSYWKLIILEYLCNYKAKEISIKDISQETGVNAYDIISTLQAMGMLKYWKGKHLILTRQDILDDYRVNRRKKDSFKRIDPSCLRWSPPVSAS